MRWLLMTGLFVSAIVAATLYPSVIQINAAASYSPDRQDEPVLLYFWADRKHANQFRISNQYQLQYDRGRVTGRLFSIIYAAARPDQIKLGFYLDVAELPSVAEQQVFSVSQLNRAEQ